MGFMHLTNWYFNIIANQVHVVWILLIKRSQHTCTTKGQNRRKAVTQSHGSKTERLKIAGLPIVSRCRSLGRVLKGLFFWRKEVRLKKRVWFRRRKKVRVPRSRDYIRPRSFFRIRKEISGFWLDTERRDLLEGRCAVVKTLLWTRALNSFRNL